MKIIELLIALSCMTSMTAGGLTVVVSTSDNPSPIIISLYLTSLLVTGILLRVLEKKIENLNKK
jgi:Tol biopolymer transport system component